MSSKLILSVLLLLVNVGGVLAQDLSSADDYNDICIQEDFIWGATEGGVVCWDTRDMSSVRFTRQNGLVNDWVVAIAVDPDGTVWAGTPTGLSQYKESKWTTCTEADGFSASQVLTLDVGPDGSLWVGTWAYGVYRFHNGTWTNYTTKDGLVSDNIMSIAVDSHGVVWMGAYDGGWVSRFDGISWKTFTVGQIGEYDQTHAIAIGPDDVVWVGTGTGVSRFDGQTWSLYTEKDGLPLRGSGILSIAIGPNGDPWFGIYNNPYVVHFDGKTFTSYPIPSDPYELGFDSRGVLWAGLYRGGLNCFDEGNWVRFIAANGPADKNVTALTVAADEDVWMGTQFGVSCFNGKIWKTFTTADGLASNSINSLSMTPDGAIWAGTSAGVNRFDGSHWEKYTPATGQAIGNVTALETTVDGVVWVSTMDGVSRFNGDGWKSYTSADGLVDNRVTSLALAPDGAVWFGTLGGVSRFDGATWTSYKDIPGWDYNDVYKITVGPAGEVWVAKSRGVCRFDGASWTMIDNDDRLNHTFINSMKVDIQGRLWLGTDAGIFRKDGDEFTWFTSLEGQSINGINSIVFGPNGIFFGTKSGVYIYGSGPGIFKKVIEEKKTMVEISKSTPSCCIILANVPNPFNPSTAISFTLPQSGLVSLTVYDITGRKVTELVRGFQSAGRHTVVWNAEGCASGVYFCALKAVKAVETKKMLLMR